MPTRHAHATWEGGLQGGKGSFAGESRSIGGNYSFGSRFAEASGTNPEELLAAAQAACFSMALAGGLEKNGTPAERVHTEAACTVERQGEGFTITTMKLKTRVRAEGIDEATFQQLAEGARTGCPVARALTGVQIELDAALEA